MTSYGTDRKSRLWFPLRELGMIFGDPGFDERVEFHRFRYDFLGLCFRCDV